MNAPPFPPNPAFGQYYGNWVWSGTRWVCTNTNGVRIITKTFPASAPWCFLQALPARRIVTACA